MSRLSCAENLFSAGYRVAESCYFRLELVGSAVNGSNNVIGLSDERLEMDRDLRLNAKTITAWLGIFVSDGALLRRR